MSSYLISILSLLLLSGCLGDTSHSYSFDLNGGDFKSVDAAVCDKTYAGRADNGYAEGAFSMGCLGALVLTLVAIDGNTSTCTVGYIDSEEDPKVFRFSVNGQSCKLVG
jgi:hypothetical protein